MNSKVKAIALTGLAAAMIATLSVWQIPMPFGVPLTFQVFAVSFAGYALGRARGTVAVLVYIALGTAGLPLFSGFQGGLSVVIGPAGGFILGFTVLSLFCGFGAKKKPLPALLFGLLGLLLCHTAGVLQFVLVTKGDPFSSFLAVSLPYLLKDSALIAAAYFLSRPIRKNISKS